MLDDSTMISVSIVIIIFAVVSLEKSFRLLHLLTKDSAFNNMILRIEKELMIVGSTAFIFKLISSSTGHWNEALDFADLLIPIFSFCYCAIGFILIVSSLRQCNIWSKSFNVQLIELLDEFLERSRDLHFKLRWKALDPIIVKIEFRIFHSIFCDFFHLKPNSVAFDEYAARVYEKFVFSIVSIEFSHWLYLSTIVLANWARIALRLQFHDCEFADDDCQQMNDIVMFTGAGGLLFMVTTILVNESRNLELRIMAKKSITSYKSYHSFLRSTEDNFAEAKVDEAMDEATLRRIAREEKNIVCTERLAKENSFGNR